jgi:hypothetical protein
MIYSSDKETSIIERLGGWAPKCAFFFAVIIFIKGCLDQEISFSVQLVGSNLEMIKNIMNEKIIKEGIYRIHG